MSQINPKLLRRPSMTITKPKNNQYVNTQRRRTLAAINNDFLNSNTTSSFSVPLLIDTMNTFHQTTQTMEEEIMLPLRLKDVPVEDIITDGRNQPENWHDIYTFIQDMRNQLQSSRPFADDDQKIQSNEKERKYSNDDEGIILANYDHNGSSSASSTTSSSDEFERNSNFSIVQSCETIKEELKYHYYGLFRSLDNLTTLANRVKEKYHEECH